MANTGPIERCKNCFSILSEEANYCENCGQKRINVKDHSVWHLIVESIGAFFHFNSRFFATFRPLLFRPGFLTNEYLAGRRIRYFEPFKLFLFISFFYFFTTGILNHNSGENEYGPIRPMNTADSLRNVKNDNDIRLTLGGVYDKAIGIPDDSLRKLVRKEGLKHFVNQRFPDASWYTKFMIKQVVRNRLHGSESFRDNMHKTLPKLVFILIPFYAFLLKILYSRKKIPYYNHVIFSFHFLSLFFLMNGLKEIINLITSWINPVIYLFLLVYLFMALRRVYSEKRFASLWKLLVLLTGSLFILLIFFILAVMISVMMI